MVAKKNSLKTISEITDKQKKFIDILVENWGSITKVDALLKQDTNPVPVLVLVFWHINF